MNPALKNWCLLGALLAPQVLSASILAQTPPPDRWQALNFLLGTCSDAHAGADGLAVLSRVEWREAIGTAD
jgi:hypothetical protein